MTWHRALLLALLLVGIGSVPGDAVTPQMKRLLGGKVAIPPPPVGPGKVLLVDGVSHILLVDGVSRLCLAGGC